MSLAKPLQLVGRTQVRVNGRTLVYFAGCDYFRLASHPRILQAVRDGLKKYGLNVAASRLTTGNHKLYEALEDRLARFFRTESATLASNGYAPNLMAAQALAGQYSHALIDERAHGSLVDAAQFLDCPVIRFKHRDPADLARLLDRLGKICPILLTDGLFAHDGSVAPIRDYLRRLPTSATVLLDDAHGAGVLGANGRGTPEHTGVPTKQIIQCITLSKAFGVYGGAVLGPQKLKDAIMARSRLFVGNTPLPLPLAHAALVSLNLLHEDHRLHQRLRHNVENLKQRLRDGGFPVPDHPGPIVAVIPRGQKHAAVLSRRLLAAGIHPPFIKYPGGPANGSFRFAISSGHTAEQLRTLARVLLAI